ncbi:RNA polymerase sigma factor [Actinoplanes italicus]|uniref:RNA polymerase sigma factor (Sigma-70 family) n=1 Tax=Actinoplanes italicus TaxID=113567 RepID=A0A2T0KJ12_9ACTN|nr:sigma-70 family RNA polymerase sigma factor [Actinoplanes italicus]PRX23508.1 RNA polymerase sigma factor (sigma-70 family) [Actinoplanes italicus]GIE30004.1 RNA polymerase sigma factor [Actinoplanes italicus]
MTAPTVDEGLDLVRRHQAGDPDAFAEIYRSHYDTVYRFVYRRLPDKYLAQDLTHDTFTRAFARLTTNFECRDKAIGAWLVTIARNLISDHFKKKSNRSSSLFDIVPEDSADRLRDSRAPAADEPVLAAMAHAELRARLLVALELLTEPQRNVIILRFFRELSIADASAEMGMTDAALKTLTWRATQSLARYMRRSS